MRDSEGFFLRSPHHDEQNDARGASCFVHLCGQSAILGPVRFAGPGAARGISGQVLLPVPDCEHASYARSIESYKALSKNVASCDPAKTLFRTLRTADTLLASFRTYTANALRHIAVNAGAE